MTPGQLAQLQSVNSEVNQIHYNAVMGIGEPPDWWSSVSVKGWSWVCRMFAEMKSDRLEALGWPENDLWTVICWTELVESPISGDPYSGRERHAVLEVRLPGETWILDSRFDAPYRWDDPPADYRWEGEQTPDDLFRDVSKTGLTVLLG